jgi:hypothetical protein
MRMGREALEGVTGCRIHGYRSIRRSFSESELWLIDLVAEEGYSYDSSLMPRGFGRAAGVNPREPFVRPTRRGKITELPHSTASFLGYRLPVGGGNFLRQLPASFTFGEFRRWVKKGDAPFVLYFHPWELDSDIPEVSAFDRLTHVRQYRNLGKLREMLPRYFEEAEFGTAGEYLGLAATRLDSTPAGHRTLKPAEAPATPRSGSEEEVSVVIPCHNEEAAIDFLSRALNEVDEAAEGRYRIHYYLVDDKSTDSTVELLRETFGDSTKYTVIELPENLGVSGAIHAGIDAANTDIVCSMDADCSYDPLELLRMIPHLDDGTALVTASPYHGDGAVLGVPGWRLFLSRGLSGIYKLFLTQKLATYTSCFRVYRREVVQEWKPEHGDFRGIVELLARLDMAGHDVKEYPTTLQSRIFGFSKMRTLKTIRDHLRLLWRMPKYRKQTREILEQRAG